MRCQSSLDFQKIKYPFTAISRVTRTRRNTSHWLDICAQMVLVLGLTGCYISMSVASVDLPLAAGSDGLTLLLRVC